VDVHRPDEDRSPSQFVGQLAEQQRALERAGKAGGEEAWEAAKIQKALCGAGVNPTLIRPIEMKAGMNNS